MDEYMKTMESFNPNTYGTGKAMGEAPIMRIDGVPNTTTTKDEDQTDFSSYLAPKTIEVRRYTLKK